MGILNGKIALVTGAGRGIGKAIALVLAREGAFVFVNSFSIENATRTVNEILAIDGKGMPAPGNIADHSHIEKIFNDVIKREGKLHILVNNAGITRDGLLVRMKDSDWDEVLNINLRGAFIATREAAKIMMKQKEGSIVNISSVVGVVGNPGQANYAASKAGLIGFTKAVARELASRNVTVNAIAPGFIDTDMTAKLNEEARKMLLDRIPLGRLGKPEDIAEAVLFLVSPGAEYITGQLLNVDGGMVM